MLFPKDIKDPKDVDSSGIENTTLYKLFVLNDEFIVNKIKSINLTPETINIVDKISVIVIGCMNGIFNNKAIKIITDNQFITSLITGNIDTERISTLLKLEIDNRVDSSFEAKLKYKYISLDEYQESFDEKEKEYKSRIDMLEHQLEEKNKENIILRTENNEHNSIIAESLDNIKVLKEENDRLSDEILNMKLKIDEYEENKIELIEENSILKDDNDDYKDAETNLTNEIKELEKKIETCMIIENELSDDIKILENKIEQHEDSYVDSPEKQSTNYRHDSQTLTYSEEPLMNNRSYIVSNNDDERIKYQPAIKTSVNPRLIGIINSISGR